MASDYCYDKELERALERNAAGEARVVPIILRPCEWHESTFGSLKALPKDGEPVTKWLNQDEAFLDIAKEIRRIVEEIRSTEGHQKVPELELKKPVKLSVQLPSPTVGFIPRHDNKGENLVEKIKQSLSKSDHHTVVLWGSGGVGKTTLAAQFARASENEKQIVWISADGRADFTAGVLLDEIATQLGWPEIRQLPPLLKHTQVLSLLVEKSSLIILDNFETIKPEYQHECLEFLKIRNFESLVTTRERIEGVKNENINEMSEEEANAFLQRLIDDSAFPSAFTEEICQKTMITGEYNPLVIQWIVGQIDAAQSPREVFDDLEHGEGDAAERVFDRSFNLPQLGNDGRNILLALSLFISARRKSVKAIVGIGQDNKRFNKALKSLANLRLISLTEGSERLFLGGLTRQFARANLDKSRMVKIYCQKFLRHVEVLSHSHSEATYTNLNFLEDERTNIFFAIDLAFELRNEKSFFRIIDHFWGFLEIRGYWEDLIRICNLGLNLANELDNERRSFFEGILGIVFSNRGEIDKAEKHYNNSLQRYRRLGNQDGIAVSLHNLGILASDKGEVEKAEKLYKEALEMHRKLSNYGQILRLLCCLAILAMDMGEIEEARKLLEESFDVQKKSQDQQASAFCLCAAGRLAVETGNFEEAKTLLDTGLKIFRKLGDRAGMADALILLGHLARYDVDTKEAARLYYEGLEISRKLSSQQQIATALYYISELCFESGDIHESNKLCREGLGICEKLKNAEGINMNKRLLGQICHYEGHLQSAESLYLISLQSFQKLGYKSQIALTLKELASLAESRREKKSATDYFREALRLFEKVGSPKANEVRNSLERLENS